LAFSYWLPLIGFLFLAFSSVAFSFWLSLFEFVFFSIFVIILFNRNCKIFQIHSHMKAMRGFWKFYKSKTHDGLWSIIHM
jgi:hypothetical protein